MSAAGKPGGGVILAKLAELPRRQSGVAQTVGKGVGVGDLDIESVEIKIIGAAGGGIDCSGIGSAGIDDRRTGIVRGD